jgi:beta-glucuronidase
MQHFVSTLPHYRTWITFLVFLGFFTHLFAQQSLIQNIHNRETTTLNGYWNYIVDPYENGFYNYRYEPFENQTHPAKGAFFTNAKREGKADLVEYDFDKMDSLLVPGDWNTQKEKLYYYEGTVWYKKSFDYSKSKHTNRVFVHFGASNYDTDVYLNGKKLGKHLGGFTPFNFEITHLLKDEDNFLVVKVDNKRKKEAVPTLNTDWWNYGGITRDVTLVETAETFITDYFIQLDPNDPTTIRGQITLDGSNRSNAKIDVNIPELGVTKTFISDTQGRLSFKLNAKKIRYWSTTDPYLHTVHLSTGNSKVTDQIGFRTIQTRGADILINGESIFLKGISIHEESPIHDGRGHSAEDAKKLLEWAKELGCNYVRLAHYPHNENMVRLADQMGILVWEENPVYWTIAWDNPETFQNAKNQLAEVISRDKNRASVIIWSMANETPTSPERNAFLAKLAKYTKATDPTRLISAAQEQSNYNDNPLVRTISDPFAEAVDILSFNQYIGWYDGGIEKCKTITWEINYDKPVMISEFGAGAKYGLHGERDDRWTEEYQEYLYQETLKMLDQIEQLRGISPWILVDFRSPRRVLPVIQDEYNRKGLISEKGEKKKAFYVLREYYQNK